MSVSGPSPLGTLMVQRVEQALGVTVSQQANIATGARPDAVTQPGQPDKTDPLKNPPPKSEEGARQPPNRHQALVALAKNDPEIAKLLAARNAPMTSYTASAPTSLGQAAKTILALLQNFPNVQPTVTGRAPLLGQAPGQSASGSGTPGSGSTAGGSALAGDGGTAAARPVGGNLDPRAVEAILQRAGGEGQNPAQAAAARTGAAAQGAAAAGSSAPPLAAGVLPGAAMAGASAAGVGTGALLSTLLGGLPGQFAQALSQAIQGSGLFYESHLREFAFGQRTLEQLRSEPQAQAGRAAEGSAQQGGAAGARATGGGADVSTAAQAGTASSNPALNQPSPAQAAQASAHLAGALLGMDPSTHLLVRQQLEVLANQSFAWQGEAWPGSDMEWEVQRREPQGDGQETESWSTRLKLKLPGLGEVVARLTLADQQLVMHLAAPTAASLMADHTVALRERLGLHGLQLSQLTISRESESAAGEPAAGAAGPSGAGADTGGASNASAPEGGAP